MSRAAEAQYAPPAQSKMLRYKHYLPLIYANTIIIALTFALSSIRFANRPVLPMTVMSTFMGVYFIVYALPKFTNLRAFVRTFAGYDIVAKRSKTYAYAYPFLELTLGICYISGLLGASQLAQGLLNTFVIAFSLLNSLGIYDALKAKKNAQCGCLGSRVSIPLSKVTLFENGLMLVMACSMLLLFQPMAM